MATATMEAQGWYTTLLLLQYPPPLSPTMFSHPNTHKLESILHFLLTRVDGMASFPPHLWPVTDPDSRKAFRRHVHTILSSLPLPTFHPARGIATLVAASGLRVNLLLFDLSTYILQRLLHDTPTHTPTPTHTHTHSLVASHALAAHIRKTAAQIHARRKTRKNRLERKAKLLHWLKSVSHTIQSTVDVDTDTDIDTDHQVHLDQIKELDIPHLEHLPLPHQHISKHKTRPTLESLVQEFVATCAQLGGVVLTEISPPKVTNPTLGATTIRADDVEKVRSEVEHVRTQVDQLKNSIRMRVHPSASAPRKDIKLVPPTPKREKEYALDERWGGGGTPGWRPGHEGVIERVGREARHGVRERMLQLYGNGKVLFPDHNHQDEWLEGVRVPPHGTLLTDHDLEDDLRMWDASFEP